MSSESKYIRIMQPGAYTSTGAVTFYSNMWVISASRTNVETPIPKCKLLHCRINIFGNTFNNTVTIKFLQNGVQKGSTLTWNAGETGAKEITIDSQAEENDLITLEVVVSATSGTINFSNGGVHYE